jgi:glutathione S-transferase
VSNALPLLFSFRRCPYAIRARLALAASALPCELREVSLRSKPPELLAASPKGTVPVLVLPGDEGKARVIDESLDIMHWALQQSDPHNWLDPVVVGDGLALIAENDGPFKFNLDRYKYPHRYAAESGFDVAAFAGHHRSQAEEFLRRLEPRLTSGWLCGQRATLADMALLPFVRQFAHTDPLWFAAQPWPQLQTWLSQFEESALFAAVMEKTPAAVRY